MAPTGLNIAIAAKSVGLDSDLLFADFALDVAPGSVVAVLGPSGVGKSSLLRLLGGIDTDFAGQILVGDQPAHRAPAPGFVFQDPRLLPWLTILENVLLGMPVKDDGRAQNMLVQLGLSGRGSDYPHQLSGGMQRRAALARALLTNPGLLLLDEPLVSLDPQLVSEMRALLAQCFAQQEATAIVVSHVAEDAAVLADRVIVLAGRPARVIADLDLPVPRAARDGAVVADYVRRLEMLTGP